jgi:hypothetical protein
MYVSNDLLLSILLPDALDKEARTLVVVAVDHGADLEERELEVVLDLGDDGRSGTGDGRGVDGHGRGEGKGEGGEAHLAGV